MHKSQQNKRYVLEYELPYVHTVQVGIEAASPEAAEQRAFTLFDAGAIWNNTDKVPLLYDDFTADPPRGKPWGCWPTRPERPFC